MYVESLGLEHFRCYERLAIALGPGLHVFVGPNASGKTTLLEAIYLLAVTKSHRTANDRELIAWGHDWGRVEGSFCTGTDGTVHLRVTISHKSRTNAQQVSASHKTVEVNAVPRRRLGDIVGQAAVVLFGPDDLELVKGPPAIRRHFLNAGIAQVRPGYLADLMRYRRALRQRNQLLRSIRDGNADAALLGGWDSQLAESGARLAAAREEFVRALAPCVRRIHHHLTTGTEQVEIEYAGDLAGLGDHALRRARMRQLLEQSLPRDLAAGRTHRGPHRDDLALRLGDRLLRSYGSQGQQRTAALGLALGAATVMQQWRGETPILLLDDCLSELDESRAQRVLELVQSVEQVIVTTASWDRMVERHTPRAEVYEVEAGGVRQRTGPPH